MPIIRTLEKNAKKEEIEVVNVTEELVQLIYDYTNL
jgi:hypothetical protein